MKHRLSSTWRLAMVGLAMLVFGCSRPSANPNAGMRPIGYSYRETQRSLMPARLASSMSATSIFASSIIYPSGESQTTERALFAVQNRDGSYSIEMFVAHQFLHDSFADGSRNDVVASKDFALRSVTIDAATVSRISSIWASAFRHPSGGFPDVLDSDLYEFGLWIPGFGLDRRETDNGNIDAPPLLVKLSDELFMMPHNDAEVADYIERALDRASR